MILVEVQWNVVIFMTATICVHSTPRSIRYEQQSNATDCLCPSSDIIFATMQPSEVFCSTSCSSAEGCVSFSYNITSGTCIGCRKTSDESTQAVSFAQKCWNVIIQLRDCLDVLARDSTSGDGVYSITTWMGTKVDVYCKMSKEGGGWTVMLNRFNGEVQFNRTFKEYEAGFGDKTGEHWLGLRHIHELTAIGSFDLHMVTVSSLGPAFPDTEKYEEWSEFSVGEGPNYTLHIGSLNKWTYENIEGGNMMNASMGLGFSAMDIDRDMYDHESCSLKNGDGGWWFASCSDVNPTGMYMRPGTFDERSMFNMHMFGYRSMKGMAVMIRRRVKNQKSTSQPTD